MECFWSILDMFTRHRILDGGDSGSSGGSGNVAATGHTGDTGDTDNTEYGVDGGFIAAIAELEHTVNLEGGTR